MAINGSKPTPTSRTLMERMWRRIDQAIAEKIDSAITSQLGGLIKGGLLNAGMLYGSIPARETVHNASGVSISKGQAVYPTGSASGVTTVAKARAQGTTFPAVGIMAETVANGADGVMIRVGRIDGIDTSPFSVGDYLYLDKTTLGALTNSPDTSFPIQPLAQVIIDNATTGAIEVIVGGYQRTPDHVHSTTGDGGLGLTPSYVEFDGVATPSWSGNVNDYSPGASINYIYAASSTDMNLTGIVGPGSLNDHRLIVLTNASGSAVISLPHGSGSSSAGNRFKNPNNATVYLRPGEAVLLVYGNDGGGLGSWRPMALVEPHDHSAVSKGGQLTDSGIASGAEIDVAKLADGAADDVLLTNADGVTVNWGKLKDANVDSAAEIAVSKLADGAAYEFLRTDSAGTGVEWAGTEITWTPVLFGGTTAGTPTHTTQKGAAIRVGNMVAIKGVVVISAIGGMTGDVRISGLPFAANNSGNGFGVLAVSAFVGVTCSGGRTYVGMEVRDGESFIRLAENGSGLSAIFLDVSTLTATVNFDFAGIYFA